MQPEAGVRGTTDRLQIQEVGVRAVRSLKQAKTTARNTSKQECILRANVTRENIRLSLGGAVWCSEEDHSSPWHLKMPSRFPRVLALLQIRRQILTVGGRKKKKTCMHWNTRGYDVGFGCISEKHTICTCHWVDNPQICWIKVNLSLKNEMDSEHIKTQYLSLSMFVVFADAADFAEGWKSWWLTWESRHKAFMDIFSPAQNILFHLSLRAFLLHDRKWTFAKINYHYMGLPFLCKLGSFRITRRLLHIF